MALKLMLSMQLCEVYLDSLLNSQAWPIPHASPTCASLWHTQVIVSDPEVQAQLEQQIGDFGAAVERRPPNEMVQVSGNSQLSRVVVKAQERYQKDIRVIP